MKYVLILLLLFLPACKPNVECAAPDPGLPLPTYPAIMWPPNEEPEVNNLDTTNVKNDTTAINVIVPETTDKIYWLDKKIPVVNTYRYQGYFPSKSPYIAKGVVIPAKSFQSSIWPNGGAEQKFTINSNGHYPVTYQVPKTMSGGEKLMVSAQLYGWGGNSNYCENFGDSPSGLISIRNCNSEYNLNDFSQGSGWWGFYGGHTDPNNAFNADGERIAQSLLSVASRHRKSVDIDAGFMLTGASYGGTGSILQSMIIPKVRKKISVVYAFVPNTLTVKNLYCTNSFLRDAWGNSNINTADFRLIAALRAVGHIFYRVHGGSQDTSVKFDTEFFKVCNDNKVSCLGTWHGGGHDVVEAGINLTTALYPDPNMKARLDKVLPVFTNSTGNTAYGAIRGHYNLGLSWNTAAIIDVSDKLTIPIKYKAFKGFSLDQVVKPFPDMADNITVSVTIRRPQVFKISEGESIKWSFGDQSGISVGDKYGEITIDMLQLSSSDSVYKNLILTKGI
jgi:hypothetical protein